MYVQITKTRKVDKNIVTETLGLSVHPMDTVDDPRRHQSVIDNNMPHILGLCEEDVIELNLKIVDS